MHLPDGRSSEIPRGRVSKTKILEAAIKLNWNFLRDWEGGCNLTKNLLGGGGGVSLELQILAWVQANDQTQHVLCSPNKSHAVQ